jgi:hypothetical protein
MAARAKTNILILIFPNENASFGCIFACFQQSKDTSGIRLYPLIAAYPEQDRSDL